MKRLLFRWRWLLASPQGPPMPTTRLVLLAMSIYMNSVTGKCFPSLDSIAHKTGLSRSTVTKHVATSIDLGWLDKERFASKSRGQGWNRVVYTASIPSTVDTRWVDGFDLKGSLSEREGIPSDENHTSLCMNSKRNSLLFDGMQEKDLRDSKTEVQDLEHFETWWQTVGRKQGKAGARKSWIPAVSSEDMAGEVLHAQENAPTALASEHGLPEVALLIIRRRQWEAIMSGNWGRQGSPTWIYPQGWLSQGRWRREELAALEAQRSEKVHGDRQRSGPFEAPPPPAPKKSAGQLEHERVINEARARKAAQ